MLAITHKQLMALRPCSNRARAVTRGMGGAKAWTKPADCARLREAGATFSDILWLACAVARTDEDIERRLRLFAADCAARVLHLYERSGKSDAPRNAIIAARLHARGEIDDAARAAARSAAWAAAWDDRAAAWAAARDAAWAAAWDAAGDAAWDAEESWQMDRLIARMSDAEPEDWPLPAPPNKEIE